MAGVPGAGGPPPKRSDQRRRTNETAHPVVQVPAGEVVIPAPDENWHPIALRWFESLKISGQSVFYASADWTAAYALAESMSREFKPQPLVVGTGKDATVEMYEMPPKAASLAAWLKGFSDLLVTEGSRRRVGLELVRVPTEEASGDVSWIDDARQRLRSS